MSGIWLCTKYFIIISFQIVSEVDGCNLKICVQKKILIEKMIVFSKNNQSITLLGQVTPQVIE